jgi:deoxyribonuclease V
MPYIPTLLSFREIPPAIAAIKKLKLQPDVILVDAQGLAHPYRCGFASHLGLALGKPTIGATKSRLIDTTIENGGKTLLVDKGEVIAASSHHKVRCKAHLREYRSYGHSSKSRQHCATLLRKPHSRTSKTGARISD